MTNDRLSIPGWLDPLPSNLTEDEIEFLKLEYQHVAASFLSSEESGEKRVNLFLGFIGAVAAVVGLAAREDGIGLEALGLVTCLAALITFGLGLMTFRRLIKRSIATDEALNALSRIRAAFVVQYPELLKAIAYVPGDQPKRRRSKPGSAKRKWWGIGMGGLMETVAAANSLLAGLAVGGLVVALDAPDVAVAVVVAVGALTSVLAWILHMAGANRILSRRQGSYEQQRASAIQKWTEAAS